MPEHTIGDRYELEQPLGGGAMSAVWLARDTELERRVAVKVLARDADRTRFEREARAVAGLSHPNICQLYDYGEAEQGPYMVLEYLPGGTLEERLAAGRPLPDEETARIAREVSAGLAYAHEHGLVHRDLKPANILFGTEGRAKIADFGIARIADAGVLTEAGTVMGTAAYISPEQAAGQPATPASDVYSFGTILFRMLTGRGPFASDSAMELVRMHRDEEPPPVERFRPDAPVLLAGLAFAALAKDPAERPRDGAALLAELSGADQATTLAAAAAPAAAAARAGETAAATRILTPRTRPRVAVLPLALAGLAVLALAGIAAAFVLTGSGGDAPPPTTVPLTLPTAGTEATSTAAPETTAPVTTQETQPPPSTSTRETTTRATSTRKTSTARTTTRRTTTQQTTTTAPATTTVPTTTTAPTFPTTTTAPVTTAATTTVETTTTTAAFSATTTSVPATTTAAAAR